MKRHITIKQFSQLSEEAMEKIQDWWIPHADDWFFVNYSYDDGALQDTATYLEWLESPERQKYYDLPAGVFLVDRWDGAKVEIDPDDTAPLPEDFDPKDVGSGWDHSGPAYPLLSIGQMIEFIVKRRDIRIFGFAEDDFAVAVPGEGFRSSFKLADALWEIVKDILENERL